MDSQGGCLCVDFIAEDAGLINTDPRLGAISELSAGAEERVMTDSLKNGKLSAGNFSGEKFGA